MTRPQPDLVVIDFKELTYSRFHGKTCTNIVKAAEPLLAEEVEMFRTKPELLVPVDPVSA